jgi:hypothetical protein
MDGTEGVGLVDRREKFLLNSWSADVKSLIAAAKNS